ncbi:MAG: hypothetical protein JWO74_4623 [Solirubrobacterales bacterium]|nr:hypothetical protein [Solirubrobacterales bacterium]
MPTWRRPRARQAAAIGVGVVLAVVIAGELLLPGIAERRVRDRLTKGGGSAQVSVSSRPALRLLFSDGDRIAIRARGVRFELPAFGSSTRDDVFSKLDGFATVDIRMDDLTASPFHADRLTLTRASGQAGYRLRVSATATPAELGSYVGGPLGGIGAGLLGGGAPVAVRGDYVLRSDGGRPRTVSGTGSVAGIPVGTLGAAFADAVLAGL